MKLIIPVILVLCLLALVGCSAQTGNQSVPTETSAGTPSATLPAASPTVVAGPEIDQPLEFEAQYIRHGSGLAGDEYPSTQLIHTMEELSSVDALPEYDEAFFASHTLLIVRLMETSGSIRHNVTNVTNDGTKLVVSIDRKLPGIGTMDMAAWHILIELPTGVPDQAELDITDLPPSE